MVVKEIPDPQKREEALNLIDAVSRLAGGREWTVIEFLDYLGRLSKKYFKWRDLPKVSIHTPQTAKGSEWPHVILPNLIDGLFPLKTPISDHERRLLYVALTRAKDGVTVVTPTTWNGVVSRSSFWEIMAGR